MTKEKYDYRDTYEELYGIAVVGKNGKFGYINRRGRKITPLIYDRAKRFYWDVGRVQLNGKWGLVNLKGKEITPPIYDEIKGHQDPIVRLGERYGYVSCKTGQLLTPVKYDDAKEWVQMLNFASRKWGKKDLAEVQLDGKWGCINVRGEEIAPLKFERIEISQGENPCIAAVLNGKWGFIDDSGMEITKFAYDDVEQFRNSRARVKKNGKYGFINTKGVEVIPLMYDDCEQCFRDEYDEDFENKRIMPVWVKLNDRYGFIDTGGKTVIKLKYENAKPFSPVSDTQALAAVLMNGAVGFVDETGKNVIPFDYEPNFENRYHYHFYNGFTDVRFGGKWGVIDTQNKIVIPFLYDEFLDNQNAGFRYAVREGKKWSVDAKGNEWDMKKNPSARVFKDYLHAAEWEDVAKSFKTLICVNEENDEEIERNLKIYEQNFNNFRTKQFKSSENFIRIYSCEREQPPIQASLFSVKDECSYGFFDWAEMLDMEVRIENNLTFTDSDVVAICIWEAGDCFPMTEQAIERFFNRLDEQTKTIDENR